MSFITIDEDEWVWVPGKSEIYGTFLDIPFGSATSGHYKRRPAEEVAQIKAKRARAREDAVLAEADQIRARREASHARTQGGQHGE